MRSHPLARTLAVAVLAAAQPAAHGQVFKCRAPGGGVTYSQAPCATSGLQEAGEVKVPSAPAPPTPAQGAGGGPPPAGGGSLRPRPAAPPGVDDPLGDPQRPRLCAEQQNVLDASVAALKLLLLEEQAQAARFEATERRIDEHNALPPERRGPAFIPGNRYAMRDQEKTAMTAQLGQERMRLQAHVQNAYRLNCEVIGKPLRLKEAESLRYPPGFTPAR